MTTLLLGFVFVLLSFGGCKKELSKDSENVKKPDLLMSSEGGPGKAKVLRQSPGLKVEMTSKSINRVYPTLKGVEKLTALLNGLNKKKKAEVITSTYNHATFSATLVGSTYSCIVDFPTLTGIKDFYLINENTGVFTYIGSTSEVYATFTVNKPSMYGSYRVWIEGANNDQLSYAVYLGDPYTGVSLVSGILGFSDTSAMMAIEDRIAAAMESHLANFSDPLNYMSDDDYNTYVDNVGFDEYLPIREFEAYFGHYSLRNKIETEETAWLNSSSDPWLVSPNPDDLYTIEDEYDRVFRNQYSQVKIAGVLYVPVSVIEYPSTPTNCSGSTGDCTDNEVNADWYDLPDGRRIHYKVVMSPSQADNNANNVIRAYFKGKIRCYKKKGVLFSKRRTQMAVRIQGTAYKWAPYLGNCGAVHHNFDESKSLKRSYHRDKEKRYRTNNIHVKTCESYATFTVNSTTFTQPLN